jgi:hypothetical protein
MAKGLVNIIEITQNKETKLLDVVAVLSDEKGGIKTVVQITPEEGRAIVNKLQKVL